MRVQALDRQHLGDRLDLLVPQLERGRRRHGDLDESRQGVGL